MYKLKFSRNWNNKLSCDVFTTIRRHNNHVYEGMTVEIELNNRLLFYADVMGVMTMELYLLPVVLVCQDTGLRYDKSIELFRRFLKAETTQQAKETVVDLIHLSKIKQS